MFTINKIKLINYLISLIPLCLIVGNLAVNINVIIICLLGLMIYGKKIFIFSDDKYKYLIYLFFLYLIIITFYNNFLSFAESDTHKENFFKAIFFLRFLLLFLIVDKLIENGSLNFKIFFITSAFFSLLIAFDLIIQIIFGENLIGYEITHLKPSSFFGSENVAGGYLQKFALFFIFFVPLSNKVIKKNIYIFVLFLFFSIPIIMTGNRMSFLIYIAIFFLFLIMQKKFFQIIIGIFFLISLIFFIIKNPIIPRFETQLNLFFKNSIHLLIKAPRLFLYNQYDGEIEYGGVGYLTHFNSGVQIWKKNKIFGHGLKSFPLNCKYGDNQTCNTHPHNYVIEILVDTGILGLLIIYSIFIIGCFKFLKFYFSEKDLKSKFILLPFFFIVFFEFFPIRSSGSFFTTGNSIIIFLFLSIFLNFKKIRFFS